MYNMYNDNKRPDEKKNERSLLSAPIRRDVILFTRTAFLTIRGRLSRGYTQIQIL